MKIAELLDENLLARGISAIKSIGSKAVTRTAQTSDDAALRAAQDARLMNIGQKGMGTIPKAGERIRMDTVNAAKDMRFATFVKRDKGMNLNNYVDGKVVDIVQSGAAGQLLKVKLDTTGEIVSWPAERFVTLLK